MPWPHELLKGIKRFILYFNTRPVPEGKIVDNYVRD